MKTFKKGDRATVISRDNTDGRFSLNEKMANVGDTITIKEVDLDEKVVYCLDYYTWDIRDLKHYTKEQRIRELEKELSRLKNPPFKDGDWVMCSAIESGNTALVLFSGLDMTKATGFNYAGDWSENISPHYRLSFYTHRLATSEEVETALRGEWARRCKEKGWDNPNDAKIEAGHSSMVINTGSFGPTYSLYSDRLWTSMGDVYEKGQWATPLPNEDKKFFVFDTSEDKDTVQIGCQCYNKSFLLKVVGAIEHLSYDTTVRELITELDKFVDREIDDLPF